MHKWKLKQKLKEGNLKGNAKGDAKGIKVDTKGANKSFKRQEEARGALSWGLISS